MALENFFASLAGAATAAGSYYRRGAFVVGHIFLTSFFLAFYGGPDLIKLVAATTGFVMSNGVAHFLTAYYGSSILDYLGSNLKGLIVKWKK